MRYERVSDDGVTLHQHQAYPRKVGADALPALPPEINSALIFAGRPNRCWQRRRPGTGWQTELASAAVSFGLGDSHNGGSWQGHHRWRWQSGGSPVCGVY